MNISYDPLEKIYTVQEDFALQMRENEENFIVEQLSTYLTDNYKMIIPKKLLIRAITCFAQEHKAEYEYLMEEAIEHERANHLAET